MYRNEGFLAQLYTANPEIQHELKLPNSVNGGCIRISKYRPFVAVPGLEGLEMKALASVMEGPAST